MPNINLTISPLTEQSADHGCRCCAPRTTSTPTTTTDTSTRFAVAGLTCSHCVSAVTSELSLLNGVTGVSVELVAGGISQVTITSGAPLSRGCVADALDEAGDYRLSDD